MKIRLLLSVLILVYSCSESKPIEQANSSSPEDLVNHSLEFKKEIIEVTEGVHVAVGFALANAIMIEGKNSNIIIDTTGTVETAREVKELFNSINSNPIEAIIYTHNHADHTYGATVFAEDSTEIYAHDSTEKYLSRVIGILRPIISSRSSRMFGNVLPSDEVENNGIGPFLEMEENLVFFIRLKHFQINSNLRLVGLKLNCTMLREKPMIKFLFGYQKKELYFPEITFIKHFQIFTL